MTKILISPGYGAGWSTWQGSNEEQTRFSLTYQPLIDAIENDSGVEEFRRALKQFEQDWKEKFGEDYVCILGADQLEVVDVDGPFTVNEYDGFESITGQRDLIEL